MTAKIVTLTTDFGPSSLYVAQMKAVLLGRVPAATIVDITHAIAPQDIRQAAWVLAGTWPYFPAGTCHICVVDPGVGTPRDVVAIRHAGHYFVGPDNGVFSFLGEQSWEAVRLDQPQFWLPGPSATFHGRDVMAPVAACLQLDIPLEQLGSAIDSLILVRWPLPHRDGERIFGEVIHIDDFGNLITNIPEKMVRDFAPRGSVAAIVAKQHSVWVRSYGQQSKGRLVCLIGSHGYLEVASVQASAARQTAAQVGHEVRLERISTT